MVAAVQMTTVPTRSQSPEQWIATVAEELGTDDLEFAHRVLRSWLWMIKGRLAARRTAGFATALPEFIRSEFGPEGEWFAAPAEARPAAYTIRFARNAGIAVQDVRAASSAVTAAMMRLLPPNAVDNLLDQLEPGLQTLVRHRAS